MNQYKQSLTKTRQDCLLSQSSVFYSANSIQSRRESTVTIVLKNVRYKISSQKICREKKRIEQKQLQQSMQ